jgi:hypothetical protein
MFWKQKLKYPKLKKKLVEITNFQKQPKLSFMITTHMKMLKIYWLKFLFNKLASNSYSLNYAVYMKDEAEKELYDEGEDFGGSL